MYDLNNFRYGCELDYEFSLWVIELPYHTVKAVILDKNLDEPLYGPYYCKRSYDALYHCWAWYIDYQAKNAPERVKYIQYPCE